MANLVLTHRRPASLFTEVDRILDNMFDYGRSGSLLAKAPAVNVVEGDAAYTIEAELPGFDQDSVDIKVDDGVLRIASIDEAQVETADKKADKSEDRYLIRERRQSSFSRSFVLPKDVDLDKIDASFAKGVLSITLPKSEKAQPRRIAIKVK